MSEQATGTVPQSEVVAYLAAVGVSYVADTLDDVIAAEADDQQRRCRFPLDLDGVPYYPAALREALLRRVARNLAMRKLPLGVQPIITDAAAAGVYIGGTDPEVKRLEAPYRRRVLG